MIVLRKMTLTKIGEVKKGKLWEKEMIVEHHVKVSGHVEKKRLT